MGAASGEPGQTEGAVRTRRVLVDQRVADAAIGLPACTALCGVDSAVVTPTGQPRHHERTGGTWVERTSVKHETPRDFALVEGSEVELTLRELSTSRPTWFCTPELRCNVRSRLVIDVSVRIPSVLQ